MFFEKGLDRSLLSGVKRTTIREGKRTYATNIYVEGRPAKVERFKHTTLFHLDFDTLRFLGYKNMFTALMGLKKYYPEITLNSIVTVVEFRLII